jgi:hypothetical protein
MLSVGLMSGLKERNYLEKLGKPGLGSLEERRHQADMLDVYKIWTGNDIVSSGA